MNNNISVEGGGGGGGGEKMKTKKEKTKQLKKKKRKTNIIIFNLIITRQNQKAKLISMQITLSFFHADQAVEILVFQASAMIVKSIFSFLLFVFCLFCFFAFAFFFSIAFFAPLR